MVETAGSKLKRARKLRKLSLEDASRATKIRVNQLADLEADEFTNFANLAYAKSFLVNYAKYLHVDVRSYLDGFEDASTFGLDDYQYLSETPVGIYRAPQRQQVRRKPQRSQFVFAAMMLGALTITGVVWTLAVSYERLGGDLDKLASHLEDRERASHATTETASQPDSAVGAPAQAPAVIVPVSAPAAAPVDQNNAASPAPSVAPMDETVRAAAAALASADTTAMPAGVPALPLPGDEKVLRQTLQPIAQHPVATLTAGHPADAVHRDGSQPQKVSNNQPRE